MNAQSVKKSLENECCSILIGYYLSRNIEGIKKMLGINSDLDGLLEGWLDGFGEVGS